MPTTKFFVVIGLALSSVLMACAPKGSASEVAALVGHVDKCGKDELLGYVPDTREVEAHRQFSVPTIQYPFGTSPYSWSPMLTLRVDASGRVTCYSLQEEFGTEDDTKKLLRHNPSRQAAVKRLSAWRYAPFLEDDKGAVAIVTEQMMEEELPRVHRPLPAVPLDKIRIALSRSGCFGTCPAYSVEIRGTGEATYTGQAFVDIVGSHTYPVPTKDVEELVESVRAADLWSLRSGYHAQITDQPTYTLTLDMGGEVHSIEDYAGRLSGMPRAVSEFEEQVDRVGRTKDWISLSGEALDALRAEHFDFYSSAAGELLERSVSNAYGNDTEAMVRLIELGVPIETSHPVEGNRFNRARQPILEAALTMQRGCLVDPLLAKGLLQTAGSLDQTKLDAAFQAAIVGGRLELVQKIWKAGREVRPALTFQSISEEKPQRQVNAPVTLLLRHSAYQNANWEGLAIARWLAEMGCDLKAHSVDGTTLLHIATEAGDVDFVRYLLASGVDPSTPGRFGLPALGSAQREGVAMVLLEAGTDFSKMDDKSDRFREYAEYNHWARVIAWLDAHAVTSGP